MILFLFNLAEPVLWDISIASNFLHQARQRCKWALEVIESMQLFRITAERSHHKLSNKLLLFSFSNRQKSCPSLYYVLHSKDQPTNYYSYACSNIFYVDFTYLWESIVKFCFWGDNIQLYYVRSNVAEEVYIVTHLCSYRILIAFLFRTLQSFHLIQSFHVDVYCVLSNGSL